MCEPLLLVAVGQHAHVDAESAFDADGIGGASCEVEDAAFGAAVVDAHDDLTAVFGVGDHEHGAYLEAFVGGSEEVLVEYFAAGGFASFEAVVVEGGDE